MTNSWGVLLDGYQSQFVREVAGGIKEKAAFEVGKSRRYTKKKTDYWTKGGARLNCRSIVINAFKDEKLSAHQIVEKYGFTYNYVRAVLVDNGLVEAGTRHGMKPCVIIYESGEVAEYGSCETARAVFGLGLSAFRRHLLKKGNVKFRNGMIAMFKKDYDEVGGEIRWESITKKS
jgi:hypothetical protein